MATEANPTPSTHAPVTPVLSCKNSLSDVRVGGGAATGDSATSNINTYITVVQNN